MSAFNTDFEAEELGVLPDITPATATDSKPEEIEVSEQPQSALDDDDDDDDVDDADVLPEAPKAVVPATTANPSAPSDTIKAQRSEIRKSIRMDIKTVQSAIGEAPKTLQVSQKLGEILDKGDDSLDVLQRLSSTASTAMSFVSTALFTVLYCVFHIVLVILMHFTMSYFWQPWFTTLYLLIAALVWVLLFQVTYFRLKYNKWRTEKRWTVSYAEVIIPVVLGVLTIISFIITIAVGAGLQFWNSWQGVGTGHVVSLLVMQVIFLVCMIAQVVLTVWRPKPYSVAQSQQKQGEPFMAHWLIYVFYPLSWAFLIGCFFIIVLFGYYMTAAAAGLWVAAYILSIVLDIAVTKVGTVVVMGLFMPLYEKTVEKVFYRNTQQQTTAAPVEVKATQAATVPPQHQLVVEQ